MRGSRLIEEQTKAGKRGRYWHLDNVVGVNQGILSWCGRGHASIPHSIMKPIPHLMNHIPDEQALHGKLALPPFPSTVISPIDLYKVHTKLAPTFISKTSRARCHHVPCISELSRGERQHTKTPGNRIFPDHAHLAARGKMAPKNFT